MKYVFSVLALMFVSVTSVAAYELTLSEVNRPFEIIPVDQDLGPQHVYLGELNEFPIIYEINAKESFDVSAKIRQLQMGSEKLIEFSLIVVRQNERGDGVTEVARLGSGTESWTNVKDSILGMTFWESETLTNTVEPGVYRIEISTPNNIGRYMLTIGAEEDLPGYSTTLANVRTTQKFFGYSFLRLLSSSYVYYPLGIFFLLFVISRTWKYRKSIAHVG